MARRLEEVGRIGLVERAIADIRKGRMVILTDDEDRENEGDLVMAAEKVTPTAINFMAMHGRGLICLSLTEDRIHQLALPLMVQDNTSPFGTAFTVSIEAARGVTTGISAADRARTILAAVAPKAKPGDLVRPGHVFPLRARSGGVLVRTGQTEGSVDLARLAGLFPAGVICEVMNPDGTMARRPHLVRFAKKHGLTLLSVADLIRYRLQNDRLVKRVASGELSRPGQGTWTAHAYQSDVDSDVHIAMVKGDISGPQPVLTRMHRACPVADLLGSAGCDCGSQLEQAFRSIAEAGRGVLVYLHKAVRPVSALTCTRLDAEEAGPGGDRSRLREFGVGAQILKDLGLRRLRLLTNNPKKIVGLESYSLEVVEQIPLTRPRVQRPQEQRADMARVIEGLLTTPQGRFALCVARFNSFITEQLLLGAQDALVRHGVADSDIDVFRVPGTFELPGLVRRVAEGGHHAGVVALGCVLRGGTPHFEYVAGEVSKGIGQIALTAPCAVSFGVLTCDTLEQAIDRAGVKAGNKGADAAMACLEMVNLYARMAEVGKKR